MKYTYSILARCFLALLLLPGYARAQPQLLNFSKYGPDTRMLLNHYSSWETTSPFDGVSVAFHSNTVNTSSSTGYLGKSGTEELTFNVFKAGNTINYGDYSNAITDMDSCNFTKFKNNFMMISLFPTNWVAWSDTANWHKMIANLGVAAKIAKDSKLKGIILDTEMYGGPENLNLLFYCMQFDNHIKKNASNNYAFGRIDQANDNLHTVVDLFEQVGQPVYWYDTATHMASTNGGTPVELTHFYYGVYTEKADTTNFYYGIPDETHQAAIEQIISDVKQRGEEIITAIHENFADAKIILTFGASSIPEFVNVLGYTNANNYLRTQPGLMVPFMDGMLSAAQGTELDIIDGQEQTYYHKTRSDFLSARAKFDFAESYFSSSLAKKRYRDDMLRGYGLYSRPRNSTLYPAESPDRFFTVAELQDQYKYASEFPDIKYIWQWEEYESFWLNSGFTGNKFDGINPLYDYGGTDDSLYINAIKKGQNGLKNFVVHNDEYLYLKNANITGKNILVEPGGTLRFNGKFSLSGSHSITFDSSSYCCMDNSLGLTLTNYASFINFVPGYLTGVKSPLPDSNNCSSSPVTTTVTGNGSINTFDTDIYIQNDTLSGNQYIVGKNIYIGYDVAPARTQGEVKINDSANIIFKAAERVKMTRHFNVATGSTYLIK